MKKLKLLLLTLIVFSCGENTMKVDEKNKKIIYLMVFMKELELFNM